MEYHLDRGIRLCENAEYNSDCSWALQEYDDEGVKVGDEQQPWVWNLYFTASELSLRHSITIDKPDGFEEDKSHQSRVEVEQIFGTLHPGICNDGRWLDRDTSYSMFGTDRNISHFGLTIAQLKDEEIEERCWLSGFVSYTSEVNFRDETIDDTVEIYLTLSPKTFSILAEAIKAQRVDAVRVCLGNVSGFYSEWSPEITTNKIKILTKTSDQKISMPVDCAIDPPRLGKVDEFNIDLIQRNRINPKQDFGVLNIEKIFGEPDDFEEDDHAQGYSDTKPAADSQLLARLARIESILSKLRTPLWLILLMLFFLTFTIVF